MKRLFLFIGFLFGGFIPGVNLWSQDIKYENYTYSDQIKSVQCVVNGEITSVPILTLNSTDRLLLQFDHLADIEEDELFYRIIHCDKDWKPSVADPIEYINGFAEERLRDWQTSITTKVDYTHYWLAIPNRDTKIKISGNYILYVFNRFDEEVPLITTRFIVTEKFSLFDNKWVRPSETAMIHTGHQLNLDAVVKDLKIQNPQRDVSLTVVQNGIWNNALYNVKCRSVYDNKFEYDKFGGISFLSGNEYRSFDTRSIRGRGPGIAKFQIGKIDKVFLTPVERRPNYYFNFDFNGKFYLQNRDLLDRLLFDENSIIAERNKLAQFRNQFIINNESDNNSFYIDIEEPWQVKQNEVTSEYVEVQFELKSRKLNEKVYVFGAFTDFGVRDDFEMKYDEIDQSYKLAITLKQGYYDYKYVTVRDKNKIDFSELEGNYQETENDYTIIMYLHDFGTRYPRVLGVSRQNSLRF